MTKLSTLVEGVQELINLIILTMLDWGRKGKIIKMIKLVKVIKAIKIITLCCNLSKACTGNRGQLRRHGSPYLQTR